MKIKINEIIDQMFEEKTMVSLAEIWKELCKPPFGLLPNTGTVFLLGFLLSEYADSTYYKRDVNANSVPLNYVDLSELIFGVIKNLPKAQGQFIVRQTQTQIEFCQITGEIFRISKDKRNTVDDIAKNINIFLTNNKYPMWAIRNYIEEELYDHNYCQSMIQLTELLCEFVRPESKINRERSKVVEDIHQIYKDNPSIDEVYRDVLSTEHMRSGMNYYIAQYKPELIQTASYLRISAKDYLELLNSKLSSDSAYLWELGDTNRQIDNLYVDLRLIYDINRVLTTKQKTISDARKALIEKLNIVKIPYPLLCELRPELTAIIDQFNQIKDGTQFNKSEASTVIANLADEFIEFFNNQFDVFCDAIDRVLHVSLTNDEYENLFNKVPSGILFGTPDRFTTGMQHELELFRKSKKIRKMFDTWEKQTNSISPADWSQKNGVPVLCLFPDDIIKAQIIFDALNKTSNLPFEKDIDDAIIFLSDGKLDILNDSKKCTERFINFFSGEYAYVVTSADELRDVIRSVAGAKVYDWYARINSCKDAIRRFATERYKMKYRSLVRERVRNLSAQQAQKYLEELIDKDPLLGINILKG